MSASIRLKAQDAEDVQVVSAMLQDAIVPVCDMLYRREGDQFVMVVQRLKRETDKQDGVFERICCALNLAGVKSVQTQGINLNDGARMLDLLAILGESGNDGITFVFAGGAKIRLQLGEWSMIVEDFGEAWPAQCNPCHESAIVV